MHDLQLAWPMQRFEEKEGSSQQRCAGGPAQAGWSPYCDNGGTAVAVADDDCVILAADTRCSLGYAILGRNVSKIFQLTSTSFMAASGMAAESNAFRRKMEATITSYKFEHDREPSVEALANLISTTLYSRRFFPYYVFTILVGLDDAGRGAVYSYDAVGSGSRSQWTAVGSGCHLAEPVLDSRLGRANECVAAGPLSPSEKEEVVVTAMAAVAERDILTGDTCEVLVVRKTGSELKKVALCRD